LAGHGYSTLTFTNQNPNTNVYYSNAQAALAFLVGPANPFAAYTDPHRVGAAGHSQGAIMAALLQADPKNGVSAIVAFDNIHRWVIGDPGAAEDCSPTVPEEQQITARVPALGEAEDAPCLTTPWETGADIKETGWSWWRAAGIPTEVVDIAGTNHLDWTQSVNGDGAQLQLFAYYAQAWFDRWLLGAPDAQSRLLATTVLGQPLTKVLSSHYLSGAFLPGTIDTSNLLQTLTSAPPVAPLTKPQRLRLRFSGSRRGRAPRRVVVELSVSEGTLKGVTVELLRGRRVVALARVPRITATRRKLMLRPRHATRFAAGRYTLVIRANGSSLVRRLVRIA
jgi:pimeloyl-ACP methyl ester carboxylesterase